MTDAEQRPTTLPPPARIFKDYEQLERALKETEDQWIDDFTRRLNRAVEDMAQPK